MQTSLKIGWFSSSEAYASRELPIEQSSGRTKLSEDDTIGINDLYFRPCYFALGWHGFRQSCPVWQNYLEGDWDLISLGC